MYIANEIKARVSAAYTCVYSWPPVDRHGRRWVERTLSEQSMELSCASLSGKETLDDSAPRVCPTNCVAQLLDEGAARRLHCQLQREPHAGTLSSMNPFLYCSAGRGRRDPMAPSMHFVDSP